MKDRRYVTVYVHKGHSIQTLYTSNPSKGDSPSYIIDNTLFKNKRFNLIQDAIDAIDKNKQNQTK